ncbi:hypothetical protein QN277_029327 [Acacia crassicarpa]|uniref:Uncharacterized protein n=1 Tax=Acacia crassicarpa TaxID=499986 RepID=A0AAE1J8M6_9FABA|nr:hypothetical protein QN277_029327 [Acacia crassicarpa]
MSSSLLISYSLILKALFVQLQTCPAENVEMYFDRGNFFDFTSLGMKLQRLTGNIEFINVSFHYPSRPTESKLFRMDISSNVRYGCTGEIM